MVDQGEQIAQEMDAIMIEKVVQELNAEGYEFVGKYDLVPLHEEGKNAPLVRIVSVPTQDGFLRNMICFSFIEGNILRLGTLDRNCQIYIDKASIKSHTNTVRIYNLNTVNGPEAFFIITLYEEDFQRKHGDYISWMINA